MQSREKKKEKAKRLLSDDLMNAYDELIKRSHL